MQFVAVVANSNVPLNYCIYIYLSSKTLYCRIKPQKKNDNRYNRTNLLKGGRQMRHATNGVKSLLNKNISDASVNATNRDKF